MQLNALIDLIEFVQDRMLELGDEQPGYEIRNRPELIALLHTCIEQLPPGLEEVASMHLADFRRMIMEDDLFWRSFNE